MHYKPSKQRNPLLVALRRYGVLALTLAVLLISLVLIVVVPAKPTQPRGNDGVGEATATELAAGAPATSAAPTLDSAVLAPLLQLTPGVGVERGETIALGRNPEPFTVIPERARTDVLTYTVVQGDTIIGIARRFDLAPETIVWGNPGKTAELRVLQPGMELNILPVDGALHLATGQQTVQSIANRYGIADPDDIIFSEYNDFPADTTPDTELPYNTTMVIPGGEGEALNIATAFTVEGSGAGGGQVRVTGGTGSCGLVTVHTAGRSVFSLPLTGSYTFMQDFYPGIHNGVDLAGSTGDPIVAADGGTVVFAGWHTGGYGYLVVIDHGNGFQTYYGHLSRVSVRCGAGVSAGQVIGAMGSTGRSSGPHLHFEIHQGGVPVNPRIHLVL